MAFYIGLYLIILIYLLYFMDSSMSKQTYILVPLLLLMFTFGLRAYVGIDDINYYRVFDYLSNHDNWNEYFYEMEYSFFVICKSVHYFGFNKQLVFFIYSGLSFLFLGLSINKICEKKIEILFVFISFFIFSFINSITLMRQFLSATIILYSITQLADNKKMNSLLLLLLAAVFHTGAIVCTVIWLLYFIPTRVNNKLKIGIPIIAIFIGNTEIITHIMAAIVKYIPQYEHMLNNELYGTNQEIGIAVYALFIIYCINLLLKNKYEGNNPYKNDLLERGQSVYFTLSFLTTSLGWIHRANFYFSMFVLFLIGDVLRKMQFGKKQRTIIIFISFIALTVYYIYILNVENSHILSIVPYQFNIKFK